jgi:thioredoxin-related protein
MKGFDRGFAVRGVLAAIVMMIAMGDETMAQGNGSVPWRSVDQALTEATASKKFVLLDVYTDWCGWCKRMDRDTYADSTVSSYIAEHFIAAKMNPETEGSLRYRDKDFTNGSFGEYLGVDGYPATVFFSPGGEVVGLAPGYHSAEDFRSLLEYIAEGHYETKSWDEYHASRK